MINIPLPPFKWFLIENFPFISEDFDALTNWQLFCKLGKEMNKIIKKCNLTGKQVEQLTNAFNLLKDYIDNYFDNLDIQSEIDNKLDEMAESGELEEIIGEYIQMAGVLSYDTKAEMKASENLVNGSIARTLGDLTYSDGKGNFYKIRTITSGDNIDDDNIIALTNPELIAEKIPYTNGYDIQEQITQNTSDISTNASNIETNEDNIEFIHKNTQTITSLVTIGDSYGVGNSYPTDPITSYTEYMKETLGLTNDTFYNRSWGGSGFVNVSYNKKFLTLVEECASNLSQDRKNAVSHVLFAGGYNDMSKSESDIISAIQETTNRAHEVFPNAQIYVAFIGWRTNANNLSDATHSYITGCGKSKYAKYITNAENILRGDLISGDNVHPNENGYKWLADNLVTGLQTGSCDPFSIWQWLVDTNSNNVGIVRQVNDLINFEMFDSEFTYSGTANGTEITWCTLSSNSMLSSRGRFRMLIPCIFVGTGGTYVNGFCTMIINERVIKLKPFAINSAGNNYFTFTSIRMYGQNILIDHQSS